MSDLSVGSRSSRGWGIGPRTGTSSATGNNGTGPVDPADIQYEDGVSSIRVTMAARRAKFEPVAVKTDIPGSLSRNTSKNLDRPSASSSTASPSTVSSRSNQENHTASTNSARISLPGKKKLKPSSGGSGGGVSEKPKEDPIKEGSNEDLQEQSDKSKSAENASAATAAAKALDDDSDSDASSTTSDIRSLHSDSQLAGNEEMNSPTEKSSVILPTLHNRSSTAKPLTGSSSSVLSHDSGKSNSVTVRSTGSVNTAVLFDTLKRSRPPSVTDSSSGIVIGPTLVDENDQERRGGSVSPVHVAVPPPVSPVPIGPARITQPATETPTHNEATKYGSKANGSVISGSSITNITTTSNDNVSVISNNVPPFTGNVANLKPSLVTSSKTTSPCVFSRDQSETDGSSEKVNKSVRWNETVVVSDGLTSDVIVAGLQPEDHEYNPRSYDDLRPPQEGEYLDTGLGINKSSLDAEIFHHMHKKLTTSRTCIKILGCISLVLLLAAIGLALAYSWKYIVNENIDQKLRNALGLENTPLPGAAFPDAWHSPVTNTSEPGDGGGVVFYLLEEDNIMNGRRPSQGGYFYWHRGPALQVEIELTTGEGSSTRATLGDPIDVGGASIVLELFNDRIYTIRPRGGGDESSLISIAPKHGDSVTWEET